MKNPKTTIAGYMLIVGGVFTIIAHFLSNGSVSMADLNSLIVIIGGGGLVAASDGGH
jgi:hypothetical protein